MKKVADWEVRLTEALEATGPFIWGASDCCHFVARIVAAISVIDLLEGENLKYTTEEDANAVINSRGGLGEIISQKIGEPIENCAFANRGDIALVQAGNREILGIVAGRYIAVQGDLGLSYLPRRNMIKAWVI